MCHENVAKMHRRNPQRFAICTGYALSNDSIWRPHSWVLDKKNRRIIETTEKRVTYYGFVEIDVQ